MFAPVGVLNSGGHSHHNERIHEHQATPQQMVFDEDETSPDHVSTSGSETSRRSNNSQPQFFDFIGACMSTAGWGDCFPCAVVDINDSDDYVVDKLSRESAMNVMYAKKEVVAATPEAEGPAVSPDSSPVSYVEENDGLAEQNRDVMNVQKPQSDVPIHLVPSIVFDEDSECDVDDMDTITLNSDDGSASPGEMNSTITIKSHEQTASIQPIQLNPSDEVSMNEAPISSPPTPRSPRKKKKKKFGIKLFGRKKKA